MPLSFVTVNFYIKASSFYFLTFYRKLEANTMDHAVKASRSHPWNKLRFENDELEELYQRYTHKIQWISVFGAVILVVMLTGIMAILSLAYTQAATIHVSRF
jgi:hypothetical protein